MIKVTAFRCLTMPKSQKGENVIQRFYSSSTKRCPAYFYIYNPIYFWKKLTDRNVKNYMITMTKKVSIWLLASAISVSSSSLFMPTSALNEHSAINSASSVLWINVCRGLFLSPPVKSLDVILDRTLHFETRINNITVCIFSSTEYQSFISISYTS